MYEAPDNRARWVQVAAIFLGLVVVLGAARFDLYFRAPMLEQGDIAVNALQVDSAKRVSEIYGNYSRFEFNHPGPAFFYVYAAAEILLFDWLHLVPSPANAHLVGCMALQSLFFALAIGVVCSHLRWRALAPLALLAAAIHFGGLEDPWVSVWPPHVLLMPFLCFLAAAASVASGRLGDLPLAILAGGFLFHGHVAQPVFLALVGGLALLLWLRQQRRAAGGWREPLREHRATLIACAALAAVFLAPLAIDVALRGARSNVATILGRFAGNSDHHNSVLQSVLYFLTFGTDFQKQELLLAAPGPEIRAFFLEHAWRIAAWCAALAAPPLLAWRWRNLLAPDERRFCLTAGALLAASVFGCVVWGKAQAGGMYHFNGFFYHAIYYFGLVLALALVARGLERFPRLPVGLLAAGAAIVTLRSFAATAPGERESGLAIRAGVARALAADPDPRPKLLIFEHPHWHNVAAVALELQRRGVGFYVAPWWNFMFQPRHDVTQLGPAPEDHVAVWWITNPPADGIPITAELDIHRQPAAIRPGDEIRLRRGENGHRYLVSGISVNNLESAATDLPRTAFRFAPQPVEHDVNVVFDAAADRSPETSAASVYFNGEQVGQVAAGARSALAVRIPAAAWNRRPVGTLELRFPDARPQHLRERPGYEWWPAWQIWSIRFEKVSPNGVAGTARSP